MHNKSSKVFSDWTAEKTVAMPLGFFAYPSTPPMLPPTLRAAIEGINKTNNALIIGWEDVDINGNYIISEIINAIDDCDFFCADVTNANPNVMFEIGYAIARKKRIWLIRDQSYIDAKSEFEQLKLLTTIGFSPYTNSAQIINAFFTDAPHLSLDETIFHNSIEPILGPQSLDPTLLYLKNRHDSEASVHVTRCLEDSNIKIILNDPKESNFQPLSWYAQKLWDCVGCVSHFVSPAKEGHRLHNARYALISGLARGLDIDNLMLTEHAEMLAPIDYRDAIKVYSTPGEATRLTTAWLSPIEVDNKATHASVNIQASALRLATELRDFHVQLGDFIAENETGSLNEYFIETAVSLDIVNGTQAVFVGRKGTGKTANIIHAESTIGDDPRNLVCLIKPVGYEIEGLVRLFSRYKIEDYKGYVIESLWKYMLYTELALAAARQISETALWEMTDPDVNAFVHLLEDEKNAFSGDFTVRLERIVSSLKLLPDNESAEIFRKGISEAIHNGALSNLRSSLSKILSKKRQVLLLVDNLDKPWTKTADLGQLAEFLAGLLTAASRVADELNRGDRERANVKFSSAIFLRSDIFEKVLAVTLEPDKLSYTRLKWDDPEMLVRVIEERYVASHGPGSDPAVMWKKYFCSEVRGLPTREYLTHRILQRPRDIVYFVKSAVSFAVNRKRDRVEAKDFLDGEKQYSQYALDSILVENGSTVSQLEQLLFEFVGANAVVDSTDIKKLLSKVSIDAERIDEIIDHLVRLSFFGVQIADDIFVYSEEARELNKNRVLSNRYYEQSNRSKCYEINRPFRSYLEIVE